ncbi:ABC transporter substrate-binding protein [Leucobacter tenebrionis]|uniref:ABC transporter substrate-binding protein n=1 Tax=Leucobacter tenebrionis TaxID=2873270 RepID=UPI001CA77C86|nr:ABC transporter substrate-binding protein [Leucobacter tenebrionis]QZY51711.1 ABC transporter substrate-binding protein [Leucobacter tenebrionis]
MNASTNRNGSAFSRVQLTRRNLLMFAGAAGAVATASGLAGCATDTAASGGGAPAGGSGGRLRLGINGGTIATVFDPHTANDELHNFVAVSMYENVTQLNGKFQLENVLAEEITPNADGTEWTLRIREGIEFHHGKTVTAEDVIFSYNRILDPATGALAAGLLAPIAEMTKMDERTVRFTMSKPHGWLDLALGDGSIQGIVPTDFDVEKPVSTGPWEFVSHEPGKQSVWKRFENYHGEVAKADELVLQVLIDNDARVNALVSGQVDAITGLPGNQVERIKNGQGTGIVSLESGQFQLFRVRTDQGPFQDRRVREALRMCLDRERILQVAYGGQGIIGSDLYGRFDAAYDESLVRKRDIAGAQKLIEEAGAQGTKAVLATWPGFAEAAQIIVANAKEIGLDIAFEEKDEATYFGSYMDWDFGVDSYGALSQITMAAQTDTASSMNNGTHYSNPEYDALFEKASAAMTAEEREPHLQAMQKILFEDGGNIIPVFRNTLMGVSDKTSGWATEDLNGMSAWRGLNRVSVSA